MPEAKKGAIPRIAWELLADEQRQLSKELLWLVRRSLDCVEAAFDDGDGAGRADLVVAARGVAAQADVGKPAGLGDTHQPPRLIDAGAGDFDVDILYDQLVGELIHERVAEIFPPALCFGKRLLDLRL